ncbi:MAG: hypothetical protein QOJ15_3173 [Bradyrhizobium sp.]|jgi:catechol 2,3-dioxygenase-like lactoylglutathione lyase family enzyme|nr:hypothetical protein [Bradyrhizobium sp.]
MTLLSTLDGSMQAMHPFLPAKDFQQSLRFYEDLGFRAQLFGDELAQMHFGLDFSFLLQDHYVEQWADNFMMQVIVRDVRAWWNHIASLKLVEKYGVRPPRAPTLEASWELTVAYVFDPSGVLWHFAEPTAPKSPDSAAGEKLIRH